jgi:hypothetical protein
MWCIDPCILGIIVESSISSLRETQEEADMAERFFSGLWILLSAPATPMVGFSPPATASDYVEYKRATGQRWSCFLQATRHNPVLGINVFMVRTP